MQFSHLVWWWWWWGSAVLTGLSAAVLKIHSKSSYCEKKEHPAGQCAPPPPSGYVNHADPWVKAVALSYCGGTWPWSATEKLLKVAQYSDCWPEQEEGTALSVTLSLLLWSSKNNPLVPPRRRWWAICLIISGPCRYLAIKSASRCLWLPGWLRTSLLFWITALNNPNGYQQRDCVASPCVDVSAHCDTAGRVCRLYRLGWMAACRLACQCLRSSKEPTRSSVEQAGESVSVGRCLCVYVGRNLTQICLASILAASVKKTKQKKNNNNTKNPQQFRLVSKEVTGWMDEYH